VELVGPSGLPPWRKPWFGVGNLTPNLNEPGAFALDTWEHDLVEVSPDPLRESYRYSALVRHDQTTAGDAGISFLHQQQQGPKGEEHFFVALTFSDKGTLAGFLQVNVRRLRKAPHELSTKRACLRQRLPPVPGKWRELAVEVRPTSVLVLWEGKPLAQLNQEQLEQAAAGLLEADPAPGVSPSFPRRGGLGLVAFQSSVSFRQVIVSPLD
jgi:hypothetical protein